MEETACVIIEFEGSVARTRVNEEESSREMRPWPQPRSRRREEGPRWYESTVLKSAGG